MNIDARKSFRRSLKDQDAAQLEAILRAMQMTAEAFGRPHSHRGISIRDLGKGLYESRSGLALRLLFRRKGATLVFEYAGNHDEVLAWAKANR